MNCKYIVAIILGVISVQVYAETTSNTSLQQGTQMSQQSLVDKNKQAGDAFLKANKAKQGVVTLQDGLQYKVIKAGKGQKPTDKDVVTVDYEGKLIDGKVFDASSKHGGPISFPLGQVIPGWVEALQLMPVGSTWEIYIPSNLAYGDQGAPPAIGPGETLIFKVSLIEVKKGS